MNDKVKRIKFNHIFTGAELNKIQKMLDKSIESDSEISINDIFNAEEIKKINSRKICKENNLLV